MECSNIQERLSAYIEEILSLEERILIDEHLNSCHKCSQALSDLRKTMEYIKNLEGVEPPPWLTQKVMARIRSEAVSEKGIIQRLFYPLHIKLPIEIAATVAIAITTIYIFRTIQPEVKFAKAPSETVAEKESPSPVIARGPEQREGTPNQSQPKPAKKPELFETKKAPEAPVQVMEQDKTASLTGSVAKEEAKRESMPASAKSKTALPGEKEERISFTITVKDIETAYKEIEKTVTQLGGKVIKTESFENKNIITIEIDSQKMNELSGKLKLIGEVKEVAALYGLKGNIVIRLEIAKF